MINMLHTVSDVLRDLDLIWILAAVPMFGIFGGQGAFGGLMGGIFGGESSAEKSSRKLAEAAYTSGRIQKFLPPELTYKLTGPMLQSGLAGIAELLRNPGGLSANVSDAIRPRLAAESESIGQNFRNLAQEQVGAAARGNAPVSIKNALASALGISEERAQRGARREALMDTESLRRGDLEQTYNLLNTILQFIASGRGQAIQGLAGPMQQAGQRTEGNKQFVTDLVGAFMPTGAG